MSSILSGVDSFLEADWLISSGVLLVEEEERRVKRHRGCGLINCSEPC